jgi:hypothetical protein
MVVSLTFSISHCLFTMIDCGFEQLAIWDVFYGLSDNVNPIGDCDLMTVETEASVGLGSGGF